MPAPAQTTSIKDASRMSHPRRARRLALAALATCLAAVGVTPAAHAAFGVHDVELTTSTTQAGGHPDVGVSFRFNTHEVTDPFVGPLQVPVEPVRSLRVSLPAGLVGDAAGVPQCPATTFSGMDNLLNPMCPDATQVGVAEIDYSLFPGGRNVGRFPVYNVAPGADEAGRLGFVVLIIPIEAGITVRTGGDAGLDTVITDINKVAALYSQKLTLWGVPADPSHNAERGSCLASGVGSCPVSTPQVPFMRNPTSCAAETTIKVGAASWEHPKDWVTTEAKGPAVTGCDSVPFTPSISASATTTSADAPTGLDVAVSVPQNQDADGQAASDVRRTVVTLPDGYSISPSAAQGLEVCDAARVGIGADGPAGCPDASKIGSATIDTPIIGADLLGSIYAGPMTSPGRFEVFVVAEGGGVRIKLPGEIVADPQTGRLTTTFDETPQQPFTQLRLHFDGGPRAVLASPARCGSADLTAAVNAWSGAAAALTAPIGFGGGECPGEIRPEPLLAAGVTNPVAGAADSAFTLRVSRPDRTAPLEALSKVTLPPGLSAKVGSVPLCGAAAAATGTCPAESRVGSVGVAAGPGSHPLRLGGTAYLTEGYRGAPFGLSLVVPAKAGPFDLGTVVVRSAIHVGPDARISVETDPLPQIVAGIPLRLREVGLTLDRPGFMVTPTSCSASSVRATIAGGGTSVDRSSRFGMTGCAKLPFTPKMKASLTPSAKQGAGLHVTVTQPAGQANLRRVQVTLPSGVGVRLEGLGTICSAEQLAAVACPAASKVGGASAVTPLLGEPLKGAVHLVAGGTAQLPKLVTVLQGGGLTIPLEMTTAITGGRIVATFASIPDVPLSAFDLDLPKGSRSVLESGKRWPCSGKALTVDYRAHSGARLKRSVPFASRCGRKAARPADASGRW